MSPGVCLELLAEVGLEHSAHERASSATYDFHDHCPNRWRCSSCVPPFGLRIDYDKAERTIAVSATVTETVANAFENTKGLREEAFQSANGVAVSDIAGAGFEPATFGL